MAAITNDPQITRRIAEETLDDSVPVAKIFLDARYGRPPIQKYVDRMASSWDRSKVGVLYLSLRSSGMYAALDGMQRRLSCEIAEGSEACLPARVWIDLSVEQEAELFRAFNQDRAALTPGDIFRAKLAAGDLASLNIRRIVEENGFHIAMRSGGNPGWNVITAIRQVESVYAGLSGEGLTAILQTLRSAWNGEKGCSHSISLGAMESFWIRYRRGYDPGRLIAAMKKKVPEDLERGIAAYSTLGLRGKNGAMGGQVLLGWYNHGAAATLQLPEWKAQVMSPMMAAQRQNTYQAPILADIEAWLKKNPYSDITAIARGTRHSAGTVRSILLNGPQFKGVKQGNTRVTKYHIVGV